MLAIDGSLAQFLNRDLAQAHAARNKDERPEAEPPAMAVPPRPFEEAYRNPLLSKAC